MADDIMTKANKIKTLAYKMQNMVNQVEASGGPVTPVDDLPEFEEIPGLFQPFSSLPDYDGLESLRSNIHQNIAMLLNHQYGDPQGYTQVPVYENPELGKVDAVSTQMVHWTGHAAQNFQTNYVDEFDAFTQNLFVATFVAAEAVGAEATMWRKAHDDIHSVADDTIHALESMPGKSGSTGINLLLTSLPTVVGIGEAAAKGAKDLALTVIKELPGEGQKVSAASGSFKLPRFLIHDMKQAITKLTQNLQGMEKGITDALNANKGYLDGHAALFVAPSVNNGAWDLARSDDERLPGATVLGQDDRG